MDTNNKSLEERLVSEAKDQLVTIKSSFDAILSADYKTLMGEALSTQFNERMGTIDKGISDTETHFRQLDELYNNSSGDKSSERIVLHDINNRLAIISGYSELLMVDEKYKLQLGQEYNTFRANLEAINSGTINISNTLSNLRSFYIAQQQKVELVDASTLPQEEIIYNMVHVDDNDEIRGEVMNALYENSNLQPSSIGIFGHDGKRVKYQLQSYGSVEKALNGIKELGPIEILITDRKMPELDGYDLLDIISEENNKRSRKPEFWHIKHIAMLTAGITQEEADHAQQTYGITVLTKPFQPLQLEQQIYGIINQKNQNH